MTGGDSTGLRPWLAAAALAALWLPLWALWGGASIMLFSSLMSVALQWPTLVRAFHLQGGGALRWPAS